MSLLTGPLDYTSVTTQSVLKGIDSAVQTATNEAALVRKQQEQAQQRVAGIENAMSKLKGSADTLTPRQRQVFGAYYNGYQQLINQYAEDPSQDNLNKINETIGSLEGYLNNAKGQYLSDKKSYSEVLTNPTIAQESIDVVTQRQNERHGQEGIFDAVEFDPATLSVRVVDKRFGVGEKTPVQEHPLYNPTSDNILLYTPKQDKPKFVDNLSYGSSKSGIFDAVPPAERKSKFISTANLELDQTPFLLYSAVVEKAARDGVTEVDPQLLLTDPNYADFRNQAKSEYAENAYNQAYREINQAASRRTAGTNPYSNQVVKVSVDNSTVDIPLLQSPKKLVVDTTPGQANAVASEMVIDGFKILPNNGGVAVREQRQEKKYFNKATGAEVNSTQAGQLAIANNLAIQEYPIFTTRIITDPKEYAGVLTALRRAELIK
jgi:hypothetical protein